MTTEDIICEAYLAHAEGLITWETCQNIVDDALARVAALN